MSLQTHIIPQRSLDAEQRCEMYALYARFFGNTHPDRFSADLSAKDAAIVLACHGRIVGFSTLRRVVLRIGEREHAFLFSGDTIVDPAHRRESTLAGSFGHYVLRMLEQHPGQPLHWFLISKGYRTYRFLPIFFRQFHPVHSQATSKEHAALLDAIARHLFGQAWDACTGLLRFGGLRDRLRPEHNHIAPGRLEDPHIRFFVERNPGHVHGDELACLTELSHQNLNRYAWRAIRQAHVVWHE